MSAYAPPGSMAWSVPQYPAAMPAQSMPTPPLKFFIERNDGSLVPLVPVDELPDDVRLLGVPSTLDASQVKGMLFLGREPSARIKFSHARSRSIRESEASSLHMHTQPLPAPTYVSVPTATAKSLNSSKPGPYNVRPVAPSGIEPDQRKKIYCTYWIQNQGQCAFTQQGCIYKHEMPEDKETLESIGLKSVPAWWRKEQARKKSKAKRTERNGSISEWEVVERHQTENSVVHSGSSVHVRAPSLRPASTPITKQVVHQYRSEPTAQKDASSSDIASDAATAGSSAPALSPPGGVKLGAAKTPVRGPPSLPFRKQTVDSPIEDGDEEDLIDFDVLVPLSSPGISSLSQASPEALAGPQSKADVVSRRSKVVTKGGVSMSPGTGTRSSNKGSNRRGSAENKIVSPMRQRNTAKGKVETGIEKVEHGSGVSRRGRVKTKAVAEVAAKATGEIDTQSDGEA
ncbi:unnamed protein product [Aureobasidium mustum]|uniref:C3H1-type domain-containing protein n=1 Tax=Aureobasidium mustum TaxID=2773714 RepID=A0A9N8PEN4_9PEZI|nr:unnamed protein product [Aureobasidium mustum]